MSGDISQYYSPRVDVGECFRRLGFQRLGDITVQVFLGNPLGPGMFPLLPVMGTGVGSEQFHRSGWDLGMDRLYLILSMATR